MAQKHNVSCIEQPMTVATTEQGPQKRYRRLRFPSFDSVVWSEKNPLLQKGELGHEKDTGRFKVGDGVTYWEDLPYNSVGDKGDKGDNAIINGYNTINIVEGRNISVEQEGDTLIISAQGEASGSYNKEEIDNKFAVVNASIDANADAIQKTRDDYIEADSEIHQILNSHAGELTTLKNNQDDLGDQVSGIEEKIPETASGTNHLITKQQLLDAEMDIREEISAVDSSAVHKAGAETITGRKTFSDTILTGAGTGIRITGTEHNYVLRSAGATPEHCGLYFDNNASIPAFIATDTKITIGSSTIVPHSITPSSSDNSTRIATTAFVTTKDSNAVHKTGNETIKDKKTFETALKINDTGKDATVTPTSNRYWGGVEFADKNGVITGYLRSNHYTSGRIVNDFQVTRKIDGTQKYANIGVAIDADGTVVTECPTPSSSSNGTQIATTAWVNTRLGGTGITSTEIGYLDGVTSAIQTQLNGKANTAASNFTTAGKGTIVNLTVPNYSAGVAFTLNKSTSYTAPKDGFVFIYSNKANDLYSNIKVNGTQVGYSISYHSHIQYFFPVAKGTVISTDYDSILSARFYPLKGAN